jgi:catechol 2,3-dioxygenase-like lactoylglutathione lyase family enzyme
MKDPASLLSQPVPSHIRRKLELPAIGQIGFVVRDSARTAEFYQRVFGLGPWTFFEGETLQCTNRDKAVTIRGKIGMAQIGPVQFELVQILAGESIHLEHLNEKGEGLHHLGFFVRNLEPRLKACEEAGIAVLQRGSLKQSGLTIEYAYLDTVAIGGVVFEYIEPRLGKFPVKMNPWIMKWTGRLGAAIRS